MVWFDAEVGKKSKAKLLLLQLLYTVQTTQARASKLIKLLGEIVDLCVQQHRLQSAGLRWQFEQTVHLIFRKWWLTVLCTLCIFLLLFKPPIRFDSILAFHFISFLTQLAYLFNLTMKKILTLFANQAWILVCSRATLRCQYWWLLCSCC